MNSITTNLERLAIIVEKLKKEGKKIVLAHGACQKDFISSILPR
jgi:hypothetical protein